MLKSLNLKILGACKFWLKQIAAYFCINNFLNQYKMKKIAITVLMSAFIAAIPVSSVLSQDNKEKKEMKCDKKDDKKCCKKDSASCKKSEAKPEKK